MGPFFGRKRELDQLQLLLKKSTASLVAITGRRRIGKSRLIQEFAQRNPSYRFLVVSGLAPAPGITPKTQRQEFARQIERRLSIPPIASGDWSDLFSNLGAHTKKGKWIVLLDEISWMGMKAPEFLPKLKNAWDLEFKQNPELILILCGSVSSWIERNLLSSTGFVGRVTSRLRLEELTASECLGFWRSSPLSAYDQLKMLSVTGGVPRYLEEVIPSLSTDDNIKRLCFQPEGLLFSEFDQIFSDLFTTRQAVYRHIVELLAAGPASPQKICGVFDLPRNGVTSQHLDNLVSAGFAARDFSWNLKSGKPGKLSRYRLSDNYLRFYLKYVLPNRDAISEGRFADRPMTTLPGWDTIMGFQFENLALRNRRFIWEACGIAPSEVIQDGPFFQTKTRRREGCQIDYLIQTKQGPLYLCGIKFRRNPVGMEIKAELGEKIRRLETPRHSSIMPVVIHVNGVTEQVKYDDFLARVIDFTTILK